MACAEFEELGLGVLAEPGVEFGLEFVVVVGAFDGVAEVGGVELGVAEEGEEGRDLAFEGADAGVAIGAWVEGPDCADMVAGAQGDFAFGGAAGAVEFEHAGHAFLERDVDPIAFTVDEGGVVGGDGGAGGVEAAEVEGLAPAGDEGFALVHAGEGHDAAHGEDGDVGGGEGAVGAVLAVGGDGDDGEGGVFGAEVDGIEPSCGEGAGGAVFDDDVGGASEGEQLVLGGPDAVLAGEEVDGFVGGEVFDFGFDANDDGAEAGEPAGGVGGGDAATYFEDADGFEGQGAGGWGFHRRRILRAWGAVG